MFGDIGSMKEKDKEKARLGLSERIMKGEPVQPMVTEAIRHLGLQPFPEKSHIHCRHHRWGASYCLVFQLVSMIAIRSGNHADPLNVWNEKEHTDKTARELDPKYDQKEHPGHFLLRAIERSVLISGDGRVLQPDGQKSLWERYMNGESESELVRSIERWLGLDG